MTLDARLTDVLDTEGAAAPPRRNGELLFTAPWESRVFGLTMLLHGAGLFQWDDFRALLIEEIRTWEAKHPDGHGWSYYQRWQSAFERLLAIKGLCSVEDLDRRSSHLASRPPGHDHASRD